MFFLPFAEFCATLFLMARPGRPKLPATQKRRRRITINLTDEEWRKVRSVSGEQTASDYVRGLVRAALNVRSKEEED